MAAEHRSSLARAMERGAPSSASAAMRSATQRRPCCAKGRASSIAAATAAGSAGPTGQLYQPMSAFIVGSDQDLDGSGMAQEVDRACGQAIGAGLEDDDEVADLGARQFHLVGQEIERRAETADDARRLAGTLAHAIADGHGIVAPDHLAEIAGRGEVMVETAIRHQKDLAAREFAIEDARDIDAGLADDVAPELDDDLRLRQRLFDAARDETREVLADGIEVERRILREIRDAEAAADIEMAKRHGRIGRERDGELDDALLHLDQHIGAEVLRAA